MVFRMTHKMLLMTYSAVLVPAFAQATTLEKLPSFEVPAFDYRRLSEGDTPDRVLRTLEQGGILALKNIPNYASLRERYLESAVRCALASDERGTDIHTFLSTKTFADGTRRLTLRANAGLELENSGTTENARALESNCPGYRQLHLELSRALEHAVNTFGAVLDQTSFKVSDGESPISSRKLISESVRLDHFHAYKSPSDPDTNRKLSSAERELSLSLHEDHGLFIAMVAPTFFTAAKDGQVRARHLASDASGLVIRSADGEKIVRPILKDDEVVIMMGTGASRWLQTSHHLPAVMHGMKMPTELVTSNGEERNLRAWFGKMTLLPSYQRLLESRKSFAEFSNMTARHLLEKNAGDLKTIGCASGRHLVESEGSCTYKFCTIKPEWEWNPPTVGCAQACNYNTPFFDEKCARKCDCVGTTTQADDCWMLCVARLPTSECALADQACSGLKMICTASSTTPEPTTETPTSLPTPAPTTAAPTPLPTTTEAPLTPGLTPAPSTATPTPSPEPTTTAPSPSATPAPTVVTPGTPAVTTTLAPTPTAPSTVTPIAPAPTTQVPEPTIPRPQC
uniref:Isopenicillin N synthase-like Fe(2+) 2OG dioxygenase domain-containing protein n=1 Tax=Globisporangium ultimum (strain ATCC 200006 / CBS 805.95 / DAOM BR144) TaxID=431595 RepID=K3WXT3_GLOUD